MARKKTVPMLLNIERTSEDIRLGIRKIERRIHDLESFDPSLVQRRWAPEVKALETSIMETLEAIFGIGSPDCRKYATAARLDNGAITAHSDWLDARGGYQAPDPFQKYLHEGKEASLILLKGAIKRLKEDLADYDDSTESDHYVTDLTGLPSLKQYELDSATYAQNSSPQFCIAFLDIDDFKTINSEIGHDRADDIIRSLANTLSIVMRSRAKVYHRSGDEFLLYIDNTPIDEALMLLIRLIGTINTQQFPHISRMISVSIGLVSYPEHSEDIEALATLASHAMTQAKKAGKNRVHPF